MHGLAEHWDDRTVSTSWHSVVRAAVQDMQRQEEEKEMGERSTLALYVELGHTAQAGVPAYLDDWSNREGVRS